ncbi:hypothetical protein OsccyDRAFT_0742 [Leptolyngbyaceae cyanobacterium JSC-12]|nr:hypothetical protein OsccyDRAFT_0742 [Leptolyngbyaceae cyanobacterium JSC-12]
MQSVETFINLDELGDLTLEQWYAVKAALLATIDKVDLRIKEKENARVYTSE